MGYSDAELIDMIQEVNKIEPYCLSIVDTFGSMYQEELLHVFEIINHNLIFTCKIGFHSHNNMQMSSALSQDFIRMAFGKREVIVDGTISGMGRGAGNTPTELIVQYMVSRLSASYDIDAILDIIDTYMDNIKTRCTWGYNTEYFIAGCYGAHVNNIQYLIRKASIRSKDIRFILNKIGEIPRKRYDYDLLEKTYMEYVTSMVDKQSGLQCLNEELHNQSILIIAPGYTSKACKKEIQKYIDEINPIVITINFLHENIRSDYVYMSNVKRYQIYKDNQKFISCRKILASNVKNQAVEDNEIIVSFSDLIKCGWEHMDNSTILLLRLLDKVENLQSIAIAGFDGYEATRTDETNYVSSELEKSIVQDEPDKINEEIISMLQDYKATRLHMQVPVTFVTESRFSYIFE
jgi:4-hydroxy 2-oxovalerate aldolase